MRSGHRLPHTPAIAAAASTKTKNRKMGWLRRAKIDINAGQTMSAACTSRRNEMVDSLPAQQQDDDTLGNIESQ